jgi:hypothetical protein
MAKLGCISRPTSSNRGADGAVATHMFVTGGFTLTKVQFVQGHILQLRFHPLAEELFDACCPAFATEAISEAHWRSLCMLKRSKDQQHLGVDCHISSQCQPSCGNLLKATNNPLSLRVQPLDNSISCFFPVLQTCFTANLLYL